ncbi:MAG: hypothetical protein U9N84_08640 [Actinomycetota bacterium]|nr:hypothetical protein [Actinomycetota bacterium]
MRMASYEGSLKISATSDVVEAVFDVDADMLSVTAGDQELGTWSLDALSIEHHGDGLHMALDGEDIVVNVRDQASFAAAVSFYQPKQKRSRRARPRRSQRAEQSDSRPAKRKDSRPAGRRDATRVDRTDTGRSEPKEQTPLSDRARTVAKLFDGERWTTWLQDRVVRWSIASAAVIVLALMALFATSSLGMILVLLGMVALIVAALAVSEDLSAYRAIPDALTETQLVIIGAVAMVLGGLLIVIG